MRVEVCDNLVVALQLLHGLDLCPHVGQRLLICAGHPLQDGGLWGAPIVLGYADEVDVRETTLGEILLDDNSMVTDLDLGARRKGAWRGIGHGDRGGSAVGGLLGHRMGGGGGIASGGHAGRWLACCDAGTAGVL